MADMKEILVLQIKSQELDREEQKLSQEAAATKHTALLQSIKDNSSSGPGKIPVLLKLDTKKDWPTFWHVIQHYLSKKKYSVGKIGMLEHVDTLDDFNNVKGSMVVTGALIPVLKGDAINKFLFRDNEYKGKGSKMLAVLKKDFGSSSKTQIVKEMSAFFQDFPQGLSSPDCYGEYLRKLFQKFALSGNPISKPFRVMFMVHGLRADYGKLLLDFCDGTKEFKKKDMGSITTW